MYVPNFRVSIMSRVVRPLGRISMLLFCLVGRILATYMMKLNIQLVDATMETPLDLMLFGNIS